MAIIQAFTAFWINKIEQIGHFEFSTKYEEKDYIYHVCIFKSWDSNDHSSQYMWSLKLWVMKN